MSNKDTVDFPWRITRQKLSKKYVIPPVIFLASLVTMLLGVIFVDGTVAEEEKKTVLAIMIEIIIEIGNHQIGR